MNLSVLILQKNNILKDYQTRRGEGIDIVKTINALPHPKKGWVLPGYRYLGPANPLETQLDSADRPLPGHEPVNGLDAIALNHDVCTRDAADLFEKHACDRKMLNELKQLKPKTFGERVNKKLVQVIGTKYKLGLGQKNIINELFYIPSRGTRKKSMS